jgi:hypothetical protein
MIKYLFCIAIIICAAAPGNDDSSIYGTYTKYYRPSNKDYTKNGYNPLVSSIDYVIELDKSGNQSVSFTLKKTLTLDKKNIQHYIHNNLKVRKVRNRYLLVDNKGTTIAQIKGSKITYLLNGHDEMLLVKTKK